MWPGLGVRDAVRRAVQGRGRAVHGAADVAGRQQEQLVPVPADQGRGGGQGAATQVRAHVHLPPGHAAARRPAARHREDVRLDDPGDVPDHGEGGGEGHGGGLRERGGRDQGVEPRGLEEVRVGGVRKRGAQVYQGWRAQTMGAIHPFDRKELLGQVDHLLRAAPVESVTGPAMSIVVDEHCTTWRGSSFHLEAHAAVATRTQPRHLGDHLAVAHLRPQPAAAFPHSLGVVSVALGAPVVFLHSPAEHDVAVGARDNVRVLSVLVNARFQLVQLRVVHVDNLAANGEYQVVSSQFLRR
ncbi:hypothetical protein ON010_g18413 [Phytophthora cinnamomi]|nr:hypothetical protein ON010_g18413 [Phytophthora cinnamomi]